MYRRTSSRSRRTVAFLAAGALPLMFACGGAADDKKAADAPPVCAVPSDSILGGALEHFISTRTPPPHRFLIPLGTDSVIPDGARYVINNTLGRASYTWPSDPSRRQEAIDIARSKGNFVTLALFYHGKTEMPDGRQSFIFSGLYTDRPNDGKRIDKTTVYFNCQAADGSRYSLTAEPAPAAAPGGGASG